MLQHDLDIVLFVNGKTGGRRNSPCQNARLCSMVGRTLQSRPMHGEEVSSGKDLGVVFSNYMKVALHCRDSYSKVNCIGYVGLDQQNHQISLQESENYVCIKFHQKNKNLKNLNFGFFFEFF